MVLGPHEFYKAFVIVAIIVTFIMRFGPVARFYKKKPIVAGLFSGMLLIYYVFMGNQTPNYSLGAGMAMIYFFYFLSIFEVKRFFKMSMDRLIMQVLLASTRAIFSFLPTHFLPISNRDVNTQQVTEVISLDNIIYMIFIPIVGVAVWWSSDGTLRRGDPKKLSNTMALVLVGKLIVRYFKVVEHKQEDQEEVKAQNTIDMLTIKIRQKQKEQQPQLLQKQQQNFEIAGWYIVAVIEWIDVELRVANPHFFTFTLGLLGNVIASTVYFIPLPTFYGAYKKKNAEGLSWMPYMVGLSSALLWIYYAVLKGDEMFLMISSSIGALMQMFYICVFLRYAENKPRMDCLKQIVVFIVIGSLLVVFLTQFVEDEMRRLSVIEWICLASSWYIFVAPVVTHVRRVMKKETAEHMPILASLGVTVAATISLTYGLYAKKYDIVISNAVVLVCCIIRMLLYYVDKNKNPASTDEQRVPRVQDCVPIDTVKQEASTQSVPISNPQDRQARKKKTIAFLASLVVPVQSVIWLTYCLYAKEYNAAISYAVVLVGYIILMILDYVDKNKKPVSTDKHGCSLGCAEWCHHTGTQVVYDKNLYHWYKTMSWTNKESNHVMDEQGVPDHVTNHITKLAALTQSIPVPNPHVG